MQTVVMDTDVIVAALRSPAGASAALLQRVRHGHLSMGVSVPLFAEYEAVCLRPAHVTASGLTVGQIHLFLDALASLVVPITVHYHWRPQLKDPADEMVLEAAINARADALLSFNLRHFVPAAHRFGLPVMAPGEFWRSLT